MTKRTSIITLLIMSLVLFLLAYAGHFIYKKIPKLPPVPTAPVLNSPAVERGFIAPYQDSHPMFIERPTETFQFPIKLGEIGPVTPLYAKHVAYPFYCGSIDFFAQQPLVDNQQQLGVPVYSEVDTKTLIGYSKDCLHRTQAHYFYNKKGTTQFFPVEQMRDDAEMIRINGKTIPYIIRIETGVINRFFYVLAVLKGDDEQLNKPNGSNWNKALVYQFMGGVGIGKMQGKVKLEKLLREQHQQLKLGYGIAFSTANQSANHQNIWLSEDTALRVKRQFAALYGKPEFTIGVGASGGAIQQYLIAQNGSDLLDGIIAQLSFPDMVSQITYVLDCEPFEYYFDIANNKNKTWKNWQKRAVTQGMSVDSERTNFFNFIHSFTGVFNGQVNHFIKGASSCSAGWRGLSPLVNNPRFNHLANNYHKSVAKNEHWSHWDDQRYFYGMSRSGFANSLWDNEGVQYGLAALSRGEISIEDFLNLNRNFPSWKSSDKMQPEKLWLVKRRFFPITFSGWGHHNMRTPTNASRTIPRQKSDAQAIKGAFLSGHVFLGHNPLPTIDMRYYLDDRLDIHHASASFAVRERIRSWHGHHQQHVMWMSEKGYNPTDDAIALMHTWLSGMGSNNDIASITASKPARAVDACFDDQGNLLASGENVWNGTWNQRKTGACMQHYPRHPTSREIAGDSISGLIFKCAKQSLEQAINAGVYGSVDMTDHIEELQQIFANGVCDYSQPGLGYPLDLIPTKVND